MREVKRAEDIFSEEVLRRLEEDEENYDGDIEGISLEEYVKLKEKGIKFNPFNPESYSEK